MWHSFSDITVINSTITLFIILRTSMMEGSGSLEQQLEATKRKAAEVRARRSDLKKIEELGKHQSLTNSNKCLFHVELNRNDFGGTPYPGQSIHGTFHRRTGPAMGSTRPIRNENATQFGTTDTSAQPIGSERGRIEGILHDVQAFRQREVGQTKPPRVQELSQSFGLRLAYG